MISSRGCDNSALLLISRQLGQRIARAAFLETAGPLLVIELGENFHSRELAQRDRFRTGGIIDRAVDAFSGGFDICECDHEQVI